MSNMLSKRTQIFVDPKVQGALLLRALLYWFYGTLAVVAWILVWRVLYAGPARPFWTHFDELWSRMAPAFVAVTLLMPIVMFDLVRLSNRFTGPLFRMRGSMRQLARGERVQPLQFREGDFWHDVAEEFNAMADYVQRLRDAQAAQDGDLVTAGSIKPGDSRIP